MLASGTARIWNASWEAKFFREIKGFDVTNRPTRSSGLLRVTTILELPRSGARFSIISILAAFGLFALAACSRDPQTAPRSIARFLPVGPTAYRHPIRAESVGPEFQTVVREVITTGDVFAAPYAPEDIGIMIAECIEPERRAAYMAEEIQNGGVFRVAAGEHIRVLEPFQKLPSYAIVTDDGWTGLACEDGYHV